MESLESIASKYNVDKLELGYLRHYEDRFEPIRNEVTKVLEIGVETGCSHRMWLEYFPNATIYGIDIFVYGVDEFNKLQEGNPNLDRSVTFKGDQSNTDDLSNFLSQYGSDFDIIIDDGGHTMKQQQTSMRELFSKVKSGGFYVVEDLHTCSGEWNELYGCKVIEEGDTLTTDLLDSLQGFTPKVTETSYLSKEDIKNIESSIKSCITEIGVSSYTNPKGYTYRWPTMLSFMEMK
jgi:hypothetical protein|tara:strand:+ start:779 stop:1483 length:705 start_codon:yes stop_codon:yes gene_type:complete